MRGYLVYKGPTGEIRRRSEGGHVSRGQDLDRHAMSRIQTSQCEWGEKIKQGKKSSVHRAKKGGKQRERISGRKRPDRNACRRLGWPAFQLEKGCGSVFKFRKNP